MFTIEIIINLYRIVYALKMASSGMTKVLPFPFNFTVSSWFGSTSTCSALNMVSIGISKTYASATSVRWAISVSMFNSDVIFQVRCIWIRIRTRVLLCIIVRVRVFYQGVKICWLATRCREAFFSIHCASSERLLFWEYPV